MDKIYKSDEWETLVPMTELQPGYDATRLHFFPVKDTNKVETIIFSSGVLACNSTTEMYDSYCRSPTFFSTISYAVIVLVEKLYSPE